MKTLPALLTLFSCFILAVAVAQTPVEVVQEQLDTYNAQDIEGFANSFAEDAEIYTNLGDPEPSMRGRAEIIERYGNMFSQNPNNRSTLIGRMTQGNFVIDHEWLTGRDKDVHLMAIYEVEDGLIVRAWFAR